MELPPPAVPEPQKPQESILYAFQTSYKSRPRYKGRVANIKKIAKMLNGLHVHPGKEFSFNQVVGPRTKEAGFSAASTYFLGEVVSGIGGGTCQVSSMLYVAALHTNTEVTDRRPHSRMSSYIGPGLDATVNYPPECYDGNGPLANADKRICSDLKFRNPYDFDLVFEFEIHASKQKGKESLTLRVRGTGKVPKVTTRWRAFKAIPFDTRYRRISWWKDSRKKLKQSGRPGISGTRIVTIEHPDGRKETKTVYSRYNPVPEVYEIGTEFKLTETNDSKR